MLRHFNKRDGITLIELLIVLGLIALIVSAGVSIFIFSNQTFSAGNEQYNLQTRARLTSETIINQIRYATDVTLIDTDIIENELILNTNNYGYKFIYQEGGFIKFTQVDYVGGIDTEILLRVPDEMDVTMMYDKINDDTLEVKLLAENDKSFDVVNQVQILNVHLKTEEVAGSESFIVDSVGEANAVKFISPVRYINAEAPFSLVSYNRSGNYYYIVFDRPDSVYHYEKISGAPDLSIISDPIYLDGTSTRLQIAKPSGSPYEYQFTISTPDTPANIKFILKYISNNNWSLQEVVDF